MNEQQVYIFSTGEDYEGSNINGVFSTFEKAHTACTADIRRYLERRYNDKKLEEKWEELETINNTEEGHITYHIDCVYFVVEPWYID